MADDEWYRGDAWGRKDRERFEEKLARAKPGNREQYLRIKGLGLLQSKRRSRQDAGVELLQRVLRDYPDAWQPERAGAHAHLAEHYEARGELARAVEHYRQAIELERGTNVDHGVTHALGVLLAAHPELAGDPTEASLLLDVDDSNLIFRSQQFSWTVAQARLAASAGFDDLAAAYAGGAVWLFEHDEPLTTRHPGIGLIRRVRNATVDELRRLQAAGAAEAATPLVDDYRRPDGHVEWDWSLIRRLPRAVGPTLVDAEGEGDDGAPGSFEAAAAPILRELRAAGIEAYDFEDWSQRKFGSAAEVKAAAPILLRWFDETDRLDLRAAIARSLQDTRARKLAARRLTEAFDGLRDPRMLESPPPDDETGQMNWLKLLLGNAITTLARDPEFDVLESIVRNPEHGRDRAWAWTAIGYVKDPRAVELALEYVDDESSSLSAVRCLGALKSTRAEPVLRAIAARPKPRTVPINRFTDDPEHDAPLWALENERIRIELAEDGLAKLEKARAAGKARP